MGNDYHANLTGSDLHIVKVHAINSTAAHTGTPAAVTGDLVVFDANGLPADSGNVLPNGTIATTQGVGDSSTNVATTAYVNAAVPQSTPLTYTPTFTSNGGGSVTMDSANILSYTQIGKVVFISGMLEFGSVSSPLGDLVMSLPVTVAAGLQNRGVMTVYAAGLATGAPDYISASVFGGSATVTIFGRSGNVRISMAPYMQANADLYISGFVFVS